MYEWKKHPFSYPPAALMNDAKFRHNWIAWLGYCELAEACRPGIKDSETSTDDPIYPILERASLSASNCIHIATEIGKSSSYIREWAVAAIEEGNSN